VGTITLAAIRALEMEKENGFPSLASLNFSERATCLRFLPHENTDKSGFMK